MIKRLSMMKRYGIVGICLCIVYFMVSSLCVSAESGKKVDLVFTHDIHSYLNSYEVSEEGQNAEVGGLARLQTLLKEKRSENPDTVVVDAGDFSMGTLFHTVYSTEAVEYRMLGRLGFDATTFGNHEFDFGSDGLTSMLNAASDQETELPPLVVCNIDWQKQDEATAKIGDAAKACGLKDYVIYQKGDVKVALTGVFGKDALECAPTCELTVNDPIESVKKVVAKIKETENPDIIICLSHSGTWSDPSKSEDELLAEAVPDLDVIISGHTHTALEEPIIHGNTYIVGCGAYGRNTGTMSLSQNKEGRWKAEAYELVSMDEQIAKDEEIQNTLNEFAASIDGEYLQQFGYAADQVLAVNRVDFEELIDLEEKHTEHALGDIMADAYRYTVSSLSTQKTAVDVAVVPSGCVRGTYLKGDVKVSDVFNSFSLGMGPGKVAGYPLIGVYLTGSELRTLAEIDASVSDLMTTARLYMSGMSLAYNSDRIFLDRVTDIWMTPKLRSDDRKELEDDKLYYVITDLYSGQMFGAVSEKSLNLLKVVPKNADGSEITDFNNAIIYDADGREVKAWAAIASYFESFPENADGISEVPAYYETDHDRKVVEESTNLWDRLKNPGMYGKMIYGISVAVIAVLILLVVLVVKRIKNKKSREIS